VTARRLLRRLDPTRPARESKRASSARAPRSNDISDAAAIQDRSAAEFGSTGTGMTHRYRHSRETPANRRQI